MKVVGEVESLWKLAFRCKRKVPDCDRSLGEDERQLSMYGIGTGNRVFGRKCYWPGRMVEKGFGSFSP